jgi:hypothetical protein
LLGNALVLGDLFGVAGLVDQISADNDKGWLQTVCLGEGSSKIDGFLSEIAIFGKHAELGVGHLHERQIGGGSDAG